MRAWSASAFKVSFWDFYTSMEKIELHFGPKERLARKSKVMDKRFVIREWKVPLPMASRKPDVPKCAKCFASFMLDNDAEWYRAAAAPRGTFL